MINQMQVRATERAIQGGERLARALTERIKEDVMHYKNGREAKNGDKVVLIPSYGPPVIGILYDAQAGNDFCNGRIAPVSPNDPCPNLKECLHLDDVKAAIVKAPELAEGCVTQVSAAEKSA